MLMATPSHGPRFPLPADTGSAESRLMNWDKGLRSGVLLSTEGQIRSLAHGVRPTDRSFNLVRRLSVG
jgi:hypothetical protein